MEKLKEEIMSCVISEEKSRSSQVQNEIPLYTINAPLP